MTFQHPSNLRYSDPAEARLAKALADLDSERRAVGKIQRSLLPEALPEIPGFEMSAYYRPSAQASGDYYDVVPLIDGQWGFVMADVSGHGTPAAVIMTVLRTLIHAELPSNRDKSAAEFLEHVNRIMSETCLRDSRFFVTMWAAVLDPVSRRLTYASAGHNPPRLLRGDKVYALDEPRGVPLGIDPVVTYEEAHITLEPDDLLVIYTDGITEAMRPGIGGRELFGTERLDRVLSECGSDRASDCAEHVTTAIAAFTNDRAPSDDQTMLILRADVSASRISRGQNGTRHRGPDSSPEDWLRAARELPIERGNECHLCTRCRRACNAMKPGVRCGTARFGSGKGPVRTSVEMAGDHAQIS